ncbi:hypothetical protein BCR33DRAFT_713046, partial [Rhizoclosmatium globosum]
ENERYNSSTIRTSPWAHLWIVAAFSAVQLLIFTVILWSDLKSSKPVKAFTTVNILLYFTWGTSEITRLIAYSTIMNMILSLHLGLPVIQHLFPMAYPILAAEFATSVLANLAIVIPSLRPQWIYLVVLDVLIFGFDVFVVPFQKTLTYLT